MEDIIELVKSKCRIEDVIEGDGYPLRGHGKYRRGNRDDIHALVVDVRNQFYVWNGTVEHGDVINWVMTRKGCDFKTAVEHLCRINGLPEPQWSRQSQAVRLATRMKEDAFDVAATIFQEWLKNDLDAMAYCRSRGWTDETIEGSRLGYTGKSSERNKLIEELRGVLVTHGVELESPGVVALLGYKGDVKAWGLAKDVDVDPDWVSGGYIPGFVGRDMMVYPHIQYGQVKYFSGRGINEKRHYNLPVALVGNRQVYCNAEWSAKERMCIVVEGQADAVSLWQWGIVAIALAGTATDDSLSVLLKGHQTIYIGLDSDKAGQVSSHKVANLIGPMCRVIQWDVLQGGMAEDAAKDANDLLKWFTQEGISIEEQRARINEMLTEAPTYAEVMAAWAGSQDGAERDEAQRKAMEIIIRMDEFTRAQYTERLADTMHIGMRDFGRMLRSMASELKENGGSEAIYTLGGCIDGWVVEYLFDTEEHKPSLAWRDPQGKIESGYQVVIEGRKYAALAPTGTIEDGGVLFPSALGNKKSTRELVAIVEMFIRSVYLLAGGSDAKIMAYYVLLTWLYDAFEAIPYLRAVGEPGAGKSELMRRIGLICYRRTIANGANTTATLFRMVERYRGTVFLDEMDMRDSDSANDIIKFINLGAMKSNPITRLDEVVGLDGKKEFQERMYQTFCPKLISMQREFRDAAVATRCITFKVQPRETFELVQAGIPLNITAEMRIQANGIRNLLLRWRLEHWLPEIEIDTSYYDLDISSRLNQVTAPLMAISKDDPELQAEMKKFLRDYYAELVLSKSMTVAARLIEALWKIYKYKDLRAIYMRALADGEEWIQVGSVAKIANQIIDEMNLGGKEDDDGGDGHEGRKKKRDELSPHRVGKMIREDLQLRVTPRTRDGYWVIWDKLRMEALSKRFGVKPEDIGKLPAATAKTTAASAQPKKAEEEEYHQEGLDET